MQTLVELEGVNGEWFTLAGEGAGDRGVYLGTGVTGLFDPPVKAVYEEPGNYPGSRYLNHRVLRRDIVFRVEIVNDRSESWLSRDSEWRKAWAFDRDCTLHITTDESGTRSLKLRLLEAPVVDWETDPNGHEVVRCGMTCVAPDPFWYEEDVIYTATTVTDTRFDPNPLPWPWPQAALPSETLRIEVDPKDGRGGLNPTDQPIYPKWTVPGSTERPAEPWVPGLPWLGAPNSPATIWTLPDYSFTEPEAANRRLRLPALVGGLRTREVQQLVVDGDGGSYKLRYGNETTASLPWNANAAQVQSALVALSQIAAGDVQVEAMAAVNERQTVQLTGNPLGGTFTLNFNGQNTAPIPFNAPAWRVQNALAAVASINVGVQETVTSCVQKLTMNGDPTSGTFRITLGGNTTDDIAYNASDLEVALKISALPGIGLFNVLVTGSPFLGGGGPWTVSFINGLAGVDVPKMTVTTDQLSGGAGIDVLVRMQTRGSHIYTLNFRNQLAGTNLPLVTGNAAGLTGGTNMTVKTETVTDGARPFKITFKGNLEGVNVPQLEGDVSALTGNRKITVTQLVAGVTAPAENCVVDTDPRVEQVTSESGSQLWSRMNGVRFRHPIPPWTEKATFEVSVSGCAPGQMVSLRLPRPWSRPWGLS